MDELWDQYRITEYRRKAAELSEKAQTENPITAVELKNLAFAYLRLAERAAAETGPSFRSARQ